MASDPIPEPLANQEVEAEKEPKLAEGANVRPMSTTVAMGTLPETVAEGERDDIPRSALHRSARALGIALGEATNAARNMTQSASEKGGELGQSARETAESLKDRAAVQASEARQSVVVAFNKAKREAGTNYRELRYEAIQASRHGYERIQKIGRERPAQLIATCAGVGFVFGAVLRIWRSGRYE
jgi:ElaB/YqjD/DUF883 family membrane-anchored ribosome-binding protein